LTALAITLVPAVSEAVTAKNLSGIAATASKSVLFASICGMGASAMFIAFPAELGQVIYNQHIGSMLMMLGILCPILYIHIVLSGILNGLGCQVFIFRNALLSSVINIAFIFFLVPYLGIMAYIVGSFISLLLVCALELVKIRESIKLEISFLNWLAKPALAAVMAGMTGRIIIDRFFPGSPTAPGLVSGIATLMAMYLSMIFLTGCLSVSDIKRLTQFRGK
ncbi:MAG: polysaccharide biosynthesis C-terminal domain-containing protein, partial [Defluviitaleaceae bacterium]|nr:polysaccharide biosynthesis C-terminal domain-containing protein [Defluviitaleaceae bacterium]